MNSVTHWTAFRSKLTLQYTDVQQYCLVIICRQEIHVEHTKHNQPSLWLMFNCFSDIEPLNENSCVTCKSGIAAFVYFAEWVLCCCWWSLCETCTYTLGYPHAFGVKSAPNIELCGTGFNVTTDSSAGGVNRMDAMSHNMLPSLAENAHNSDTAATR